MGADTVQTVDGRALADLTLAIADGHRALPIRWVGLTGSQVRAVAELRDPGA